MFRTRCVSKFGILNTDAIDVLLKDAGVFILLKHGSRVDGTELTVMIQAAARGHTSVVKLLLSLGADSIEKDIYGMNALQGAIRRNHLEIARILIEEGSPGNHTDIRGQSVLQDAVEGGHLEIVRLLLEKGASPQHQNKRGETALMLAAAKGELQITDLLLKFRASQLVREKLEALK